MKKPKKLTIVASNRNRLRLKEGSTRFFIKSLEMQTCKDFEVIIADGGSKNYKALKEHFESREVEPSIRIVQEPLGEKFERAKLNNVGVRNSETEYVMTTDVDMLFGPKFVEELLNNVGENVFVESRTMYLHPFMNKKIYKGEVDPWTDIDSIKKGRIKKRSSAGGCQCTSMKNWNRLRGFNEDFVGWGSEDVELLKRATKMGLKVKWMGESLPKINLFHQHHAKPDIKGDLECQEVNKKLFRNSKQKSVNLNGWGGIYDENSEK
jgi:predicted glycosyltransferase involved in capsule biosynthesis